MQKKNTGSTLYKSAVFSPWQDINTENVPSVHNGLSYGYSAFVARPRFVKAKVDTAFCRKYNYRREIYSDFSN